MPTLPKLTIGLGILVVVAYVAGAAYGAKTPIVSTVAKKLPGTTLV